MRSSFVTSNLEKVKDSPMLFQYCNENTSKQIENQCVVSLNPGLLYKWKESIVHFLILIHRARSFNIASYNKWKRFEMNCLESGNSTTVNVKGEYCLLHICKQARAYKI